MRLQELLLGLRLKFESVFLSVPVLVSFMRPRCNTSRTWSRWQNQSPKSLCLVYNPHMAFSLGLVYKYWFCQSVEVHRNYCQGGTKLSGGGELKNFVMGGQTMMGWSPDIGPFPPLGGTYPGQGVRAGSGYVPPMKEASVI